jgi:hypothetical protein
MRAGVAFFLGVWVGWIVAAAIWVYGLGHVVRPYDASASFSILATSSILPALVAGVAAWVGCGAARPSAKALAPAALAMAVLSGGFFFTADAFASAPVLGFAIFWLGLPAVAWYLARAIGILARP